MPDVFDQIEATQRPKSTVMPTAPKAGGSDVFDQIEAQHGSSQTNPSATPQHGGLYQAADRALNATTPTQDTGNPTLDKIANRINYAGDQVTGAAQGVGKELLSTAAGAGSLYNRITGSNQPFNQDNLKELTVGHGPGQTAGKLATGVGEFAAGEGALGKIAGSGVTSALQSGGDPLQTAIGTVLPGIMSKPVVAKAGQLLSKFLGMTSGAGDGAIARAFLHPDSNGLAKVMRGETNVNEVVNNLETAVTKLRDSRNAEYTSRLANINNTQIPNWPTKAGNFMKNLDSNLTAVLKDFRVVQKPNGAWDFSQLTGAKEEEVKQLIDTVYNWGSNPRGMTPGGLDALKQKIGEFADSGGSMKAIASRLLEPTTKNLNSIITGYSQMTGKYAEASELLRKMKAEFSVSASGGSNQGTVSRKIQNLFKQNTNFKELLMNQIPGGNDILDQIAGLHLQDVMPRGLMNKLVGAETLYGMLHAPHVTAAAIPTAAAASPRVIGETARAAGKLAKSSVPVSDTLRRGILAGTNSQ